MLVATNRLSDLVLRDHRFNVPLDHSQPEGATIEVFAREVVSSEKDRCKNLPWLLWLQGGPGGAAPRPEGATGWLGRALREFRVLLLDQRGTGRSTPANRQTLPLRGSPQQQADYLTHFRADSIVADAELLRHEIADGGRWSVLGQSFGGFCALTYLSQAPDGLSEVLIAGGLPALSGGPDLVYEATYDSVAEHTSAFFSRYPDDAEQVARILDHLNSTSESLPTGEPLTARRFQTVGISLGTEAKSRDLHYLLGAPFVRTGAGSRLSDTFLNSVGQAVSMSTRPLFAVLHESIYCQGQASRWSADRLRDKRSDMSFTGEMFYPWQFEEDPALVPLAQVAQALAYKEDWPVLYDADQLRLNNVPASSLIYFDDMFVPAKFSLQTAGMVQGLKFWVTNEFAHDGIRMDGAKILDRLLRLARN